MLRKYEAMILVNSSSVREDGEQVKAVRALLENRHAKILSCEKWDERKLCYEIKGQKRAVYFLVYFDAEPSIINTLNNDIELSENFLRSLVLVFDPEMESLSAKEQERERSRGGDASSEDEEEMDYATAKEGLGAMEAHSSKESPLGLSGSSKKRRRYRRFSDRRRCRFTREGIGRIDYKDIPTLKKLCTSQGKLYSRKRSGNSAFHQRSAKKAIKRARYLALMPYIGAI
jgi:small subunit ribosomal protein S18